MNNREQDLANQTDPLTARAKTELIRLSHEHPSIGIYGFNQDQQSKNQESFMHWTDLHGYIKAKEWIVYSVENKTHNLRGNSYHLKHLVEQWAGENGDPTYCGNGAFIMAALHFDLKVKWIKDTPNAMISVKRVR